MEKKYITIIFAMFLYIIMEFMSSCASVKPYQKMFLNQEDMKLGQYKLELFEDSFESYREGASGANGGKTGGGCGCN